MVRLTFHLDLVIGITISPGLPASLFTLRSPHGFPLQVPQHEDISGLSASSFERSRQSLSETKSKVAHSLVRIEPVARRCAHILRSVIP